MIRFPLISLLFVVCAADLNPLFEDVFCKVAKNAAVEARMEALSCKAMEAVDPKLEDGVCKKFFEKGWQNLAAQCPPGFASGPSPADIAKMIEQEFCQHAGDANLEKEVVDDACTLANKEVPQVPVSVCEMALKKGWSELAAEC